MASVRSRRLPSGRRVWQVDFREDGHRRHRQFASKDAAENFFAETKQRTRHAQPAIEVGNVLTVDEYADRWLEAIKNTVAPRTADSYRQVLSLYIRPIIGEERMLDLDEAIVGRLLSAWAEEGRSANTVRLVRATLSAMCADAADSERGEAILLRNPVTGAGGKRRRRAEHRRQRIHAQRRHRVLSDVEAFVQAAAKQPLVYQGLFTLLADHGPRPGEALRLSWDRISWLKGTVTIWATKTYSARTVALSARVLKLLKLLHGDAKKQALAAGKPVRSLVFVNAAGEMIDQSRLTKRMKLVLERAGLEHEHGLYDLRHTFVTRQIEAGRPVTDIAAEIGDAVETVLRFYAHPTSAQRSTETCNTFATRDRKNLSHPPESNRRPADYESISGRNPRTLADESSADAA
jgi:integrase